MVSKKVGKKSAVKAQASERPPEWKEARAAQHRLKRAAIAQAAAGALHEKGYHGSSLKDVAARLGMTDGALYYYFKNKAELASESVLAGHRKATGWLKEAEELKGSGLEKVTYFVEKMSSALFSQKIWLPSSEPFWLAATLRKEVREASQANLAALAALIRKGVEDKSISWCEPSVTAALIGGGLVFARSWMPAAEFLGQKPVDMGKQAAAFITRNLSGLASQEISLAEGGGNQKK